MSVIRAMDTKPEKLVRKFLFSKGLRFRLHQKSLVGRPDIILKKYNSIVFVNGCFWHGHDNCKYCKMPKSRTEYWAPKIEKNKSRDAKVKRALRKQGWKVFTVWECQLKKKKAEKTLSTLVRKISKPD